MPVVVSDHVTLAYNPSQKIYDKYAKHINKKVIVMINVTDQTII